MRKTIKGLLHLYLPRQLYLLIRYGYLCGVDLVHFIFFKGDPLVPPKRKIFVGPGDFRAVGNGFLTIFKEVGNIQPTDRVLDVGCGIGRMAVPLTNYLSGAGSYDGFDIVKDGISWCSKNISKKYSNFNFVHSDILNKHYNPKGKINAAEFRFPYNDNSFDFVFATSLYTHLLEEDAQNYLKETARVLKPGGTALMTWFLISSKNPCTKSPVFDDLNFKFPVGKCLTVKADDPESAIAYPEDLIKTACLEIGFSGKLIVYPGSWTGSQNSITTHDILVARKK